MVRRLVAVLGVATLLVTGCGGGSDDPAEPTGPPSPPAATGPAQADDEADDGQPPTDLPEDCQDGPDRTVTPLDPVTIPELHEPELVIEDEEVGGETISGVVVPEVHIPEQTVETGCVIELTAPGGCLGEVVITGVEIPELEIPGFDIPAVTSADGEVQFEGQSISAEATRPVSTQQIRQEAVCQREPPEGSGYVASVYRPSLYRPSLYRPSLYRPSVYRPRICVDGECVDGVTIPSLSVPSVSVPSASFPSASLDSYTLDDSDAEVYEDDGRTAYLAPADVLFEFDESTLADDAVPTLRAIVAAINDAFAGEEFTVLVEGHTDSVGAADYNQQLSEERAEAVAGWLEGEGGIDQAQIDTVGYGDTVPVAPNENDDGSDNPEGRAENRRVVITVTVAE